MQNNNDINIINLRSGHLKRKLANDDAESEGGSKDKEEDNKCKEKEKEENAIKRCKKSKKKKRKKSKKSSKKTADGVKNKTDEKENCKINNEQVQNQDGRDTTRLKDANANCDEIATKINPIFLWVEQKDSKIISVLCEDYDKRNRIRLSKVFDGRWTAVPRTDRLVKAIEKTKTKNKISSGSNCENLVTNNNRFTKENSEKSDALEKEQGDTQSCGCQHDPCLCHSCEDKQDDESSEEVIKELSEAKQKKQKVFLDESQNLINIVNNLMELLDGIKENSIKEREEARMKRRLQERNEEQTEENSRELCSKRRRCDKDGVFRDEAIEEISEKTLQICDNKGNVESDIVDNNEVTENMEGNFEQESNLREEYDKESAMTEEFKENNCIQYNIINKDINSHRNKINIKLSYAKTNNKIYDNRENIKNVRWSSNTDVYDFESEDQFSDLSYPTKSELSSEISSSKRSRSETSTKQIQSDPEPEKKEEKSSEEKLSVIEKLAKEKPLTNSFEASFRKFIIENEAPSSSTNNITKNNKLFELDIRLPPNNIGTNNDSHVKTIPVSKSETRTLNIKTVHEINSEISNSLAMNKEKKKYKYIIDDNEPSPEKLGNIVLDKNQSQPHEEVTNEIKERENQFGPNNLILDSSAVKSGDVTKRTHLEGKEINKEVKHVNSQKVITHRGKTISLEEFESEFVANYDEMITEDESSDDDSSYASGHGVHNGPGFDINLWNNNQSFDHNLNVIEDQQQLQTLKDKRLFDLYNRNKIPSANASQFDTLNTPQIHEDKICNLEIPGRNMRAENEADDSSFFESIVNINKQHLLHESVFPQDEEFIDLEKIQPEKILSDELNHEHLDNICHSSKDLWEVDHNAIQKKPEAIDLDLNNRDIALDTCNKVMTVNKIIDEKTVLKANENEVPEKVKTDDSTEVLAVPQHKNNEANFEENKSILSVMSLLTKSKDEENILTKDKKPIMKTNKTKDNKLDSIINKIIINKNKEEKENQHGKESVSGNETKVSAEQTTPMSEVKQEVYEVSEEIIQQINKSPILTLDIDGYEIIDNMDTANKTLYNENAGIHASEKKSAIKNHLNFEKITDNNHNPLKSSGNIPHVGHTLSWNHSEHSVDSIANDILNEFCDSNHSDFNNCKSKHSSDGSNKTIKGWLDCVNNSGDPVNLKIQNKTNENDAKTDDNSCGKLHNTLKLPKETMIYPIPENDQEQETNPKGLDNVSKVDISLENVQTDGDNNTENNTIDLSIKTNGEAKEVQENKSNVGIIKIRKSSELFMNSEQTEPLDLGNHNSDKSTHNESAKTKDEQCKEEITIKSLLTKNVKKISSEEMSANAEKSKLLELLTSDSEDILLSQINETMTPVIDNVPTNKIKTARESVKMADFHSKPLVKPTNRSIEHSEPIDQLKAILSNPNIIVPDPLLVPRSRLPALVTSPAREIPKLMSNIIDYNKMNNELLVISLNNLHKLIQTTDKDDEKLIYNQQLNYLKEQYSKINKTSSATDQNLLNYLDSNNNNKDLLNNMFMGYNEFLNPFMQPNLEAAIPTNQGAHNNVDNIMNMLMYKQYSEMYANKTMKQNQMKDMLQSKEKGDYLKELYTLIQNTYPHYTPKEIFDTMQVIQKDMMMHTKEIDKTKMSTNNASANNNAIRDMFSNYHNKDVYNGFQRAQKDTKLYQQTAQKREASNSYQHSQDYLNAQKKRQSPYVAPPSYPTNQSHHKKTFDKMSKFNEMFALSQQHKSHVNPYEKYYQQQQQLYNPLLAANLNQQPTYFNQPDLSLLTQYGNMGNNMMGLNHNNEEQLKKIQEEYMAFQQQLQMQQQNYLNYQQMQNNERNKTSARSHPLSKHVKPQGESKPSRTSAMNDHRTSGMNDHRTSSQTNEMKISKEYSFYNATRNELKHNYDVSRQDKLRENAKTEGNREEHSLYGQNELRHYAKHGDGTNDSHAAKESRADSVTKPGTPTDRGNPSPSTPKLKIKSNIIDTTTKPKLLKIADPEQVNAPAMFHHPFTAMNPLLPHPMAGGLEAHHPMEDVHPYLWHPLFGK